MAQSAMDRLEELLSQQKEASARGYADLMNETIEALRTLTVVTAGYTSADLKGVPIGHIEVLKADVEQMLEYTQEGLADNYRQGVRDVGLGIIRLTMAVKDDLAISIAMDIPRLRAIGLALYDPKTNQTVVQTIDAQKDQIKASPLELVAEGLGAMDAGERERQAFYQAHKHLEA